MIQLIGLTVILRLQYTQCIPMFHRSNSAGPVPSKCAKMMTATSFAQRLHEKCLKNIPSRELTYATLGIRKPSAKYLWDGDMLVRRMVPQPFFNSLDPTSKTTTRPMIERNQWQIRAQLQALFHLRHLCHESRLLGGGQGLKDQQTTRYIPEKHSASRFFWAFRQLDGWFWG